MKIYEVTSPRKFYHGTNNTFDSFKSSEGKFALLGQGIYFYGNRQSALKYGNNTYQIELSKNFNIAPLGFEITKEDAIQIFGNNIPNCVGIHKPLWWATDGYYMIDADRKETIEKVIKYLQSKYNFDGMLADYPNGGVVLVLWRKYETLHPKLV